MHIRPRPPSRVAPTAYCVCFRSDGDRIYMIINKKHVCLFFDQVNIYGKILCDRYANIVSSTDLSTEIVDKLGRDIASAKNFLGVLVEPEAFG